MNQYTGDFGISLGTEFKFNLTIFRFLNQIFPKRMFPIKKKKRTTTLNSAYENSSWFQISA